MGRKRRNRDQLYAVIPLTREEEEGLEEDPLMEMSDIDDTLDYKELDLSETPTAPSTIQEEYVRRHGGHPYGTFGGDWD